jgi:hypothetical protein|mmetsp:Transcript_66101/g.96781  ORF Transcript_66101/g.96781 Transcript_66101/m.96781 type:complete len:175 (-) Transcript_66101:125-649(-)
MVPSSNRSKNDPNEGNSKNVGHYFRNNTFEMYAPDINRLDQINWRNMGSKESYIVRKKSTLEIKEEHLEHLQQSNAKKVEGIYGFDGLWNLDFKDLPTPKFVARVLWIEIFQTTQNLLFSHAKHFYVLKQDGCYQKSEKKPDLVLFLRNAFWQMSIQGVVLEQKNFGFTSIKSI